MDRGYEQFCLADPVFYDSPKVALGEEVDFEVARQPVPEGWWRVELDDWLVYNPEETKLPLQGWKIHVSACLDNAREILADVWAYCVGKRVPFKFIRSDQLLHLRNMKYAARGGSGKFVTIYPADEAEMELVLNELGAILDGRSGPYILSDLRWGAGPLYVRYGGFAERYCVGASGELELAIEDAEGRLVPDERSSTFRVPDWLTLPDCLVPHLEARNSTTVEGLPYRIESALHFSNGGGLYVAVDVRTEEKVALKEARPYAGLTGDRADAVTRLRHERDMLERLAGAGVVPAVHDYFTLGDHHFLVQEFIEGETLTDLLVERYPLAAQPDDASVAQYTSWALDVYDQVEQGVAAVHERDVVIGDLHPSNMLVQPDGRLRLVDLEGATLASERRPPTLANPGFMAPVGQVGLDVDHYALACLRLYLFLPLTTLFVLDPGKAEQLAAVIAETFPVPREFVTEAARTITAPRRSSNGRPHGAQVPRLEPDREGWRRARDSLTEAILASASPDRDDRLFPGDPAQFETGGCLNIAHGAAGVLYALHATGAGRYPEHEEWLVQRATHPEPATRLGFYDGLHGTAYVLDRLGRRSDALKVLDICVDETGGKWEHFGLDLLGGLAGVGLNLAYFAELTGDRALWDSVWQVADVVAERLGDEDSVPELSGGDHPYAGLVRGSSGPALMFLRLYEHRPDGGLLDLAATALRQDLRRCVTQDDGSLQVDEGWRTMPYVADGSVGIAFVLDDYLAHREDERFSEAVASIRKVAEARFMLQSGLLYGRAGMILYLSRGRPPGTAGEDPIVARHVRDLDWHALAYSGHLAFPGEYLMRLSMDLASGSAGVMLALGAALHDEPVQLPFLGPIRSEVLEAGHDFVSTGERG